MVRAFPFCRSVLFIHPVVELTILSSLFRYDIAVYETMQHLWFGLMLLRIFSSFFQFRINHLLANDMWKSIVSEEYGKKRSFLLRHKSLLGILVESVSI